MLLSSQSNILQGLVSWVAYKFLGIPPAVLQSRFFRDRTTSNALGRKVELRIADPVAPDKVYKA